MHKYRLIGKKGEGTFSEVLKAQCIKDGKSTAIKCMKNHFDRGRHRRPHALTLVVGAVFCVVPVDMGRWAMAGLVAGHTGPSGGQYARVQNRGGAAAARSLSGRRAHGSVARLGPH